MFKDTQVGIPYSLFTMQLGLTADGTMCCKVLLKIFTVRYTCAYWFRDYVSIGTLTLKQVRDNVIDKAS